MQGHCPLNLSSEEENMVFLQHSEKELLIASLSFLFLAVVMTAVYRADYVKPQLHLPKWPLQKLKTGDLLLFNTSFDFFTDVMKLIVGCHYVHVGVAFIDAAEEPFVFEIGTNGRGPQFYPLKKRLQKENELVVVRPINRALDSVGFEKVALTFLGTEYSYNVVPVVLRSWLRGVMMLPTPSNAVKHCIKGRICTQLVADMYEKLGVFDFSSSDCGSDSLTPKDFTEQGDRLPLTSRYFFGAERLIINKIK